MPHYRFFVEKPLTLHEKVLIEESEYHHMTKVMRLKQGDEIELINGKGFLATAEIELLSKNSAECLIKDILFQEKPLKRFIIAQSILKAASLELIVEKNTELGVEALWIFPATYSEKDSLSKNQLERLYKHTLSAVKQCGRLYLPEIRCFDSLSEILSLCSYDFLYGDVDPLAPTLLTTIKESKNTPVFFIGPEQGFHEKEVSLLKKNHVKGVSLHSNILRAETASIAASVLLSGSLGN